MSMNLFWPRSNKLPVHEFGQPLHCNNKKAVLSQGELRDAAVNFDTYRILQYVDNGTFMYAKHDNLVDAGASGAKASTKHLESRLEVIQGDAF